MGRYDVYVTETRELKGHIEMASYKCKDLHHIGVDVDGKSFLYNPLLHTATEANLFSTADTSCVLNTQKECNAWYKLVDAWGLANPSYDLCPGGDIYNHPCKCSFNKIWCGGNTKTGTDIYIKLSNPSISGSLRSVSGLNPLRSLILKDMSKISGSLNDLSSLYINNLHLENMLNISGNIKDLSSLKNLEVLSLINMSEISGNLRDLSGLTYLHNLTLEYTSSISGNLSNLSDLSNLYILDLEKMSSISGNLNSLSDLSNLATLILKDLSINASLSDLSFLNPNNIETLDISLSRLDGSCQDISNILTKLTKADCTLGNIQRNQFLDCSAKFNQSCNFSMD